MAKPNSSEDQVWVTVKYTVQTRPYESATIEIGTSQTVPPQETPEQTREALCEKLMDEAIELGEDMRAAIPEYRRKKD